MNKNNKLIRMTSNETKEYGLKSIGELFRINDSRNIEKEVNNFIYINKKNLDFLDIRAEQYGINNRFKLNLTSSNYIGAIPIKSINGIMSKDLQIIPRFTDVDKNFSELIDLISRLGYTVEPEFLNGEPLNNEARLKPPLFYEAVKYIDLLIRVYKYEWVKFENKERKYNYPKSNTRWDKHSLYSYDPQKALTYYNKDNKFSINHREWKELKYVFDIAADIVKSSTVNQHIKFKYLDKIESLNKELYSIEAIVVKICKINQLDPICVKEAKIQANKILESNGSICMPWRIDISELFEKYVQYIVKESTKNLSLSVYFNPKLPGAGNIPKWGIKYLEPDIMGEKKERIIMADVKYKVNLYSYNNMSEILHDTHRRDLHQLLAYCSFEPQMDKIGILFYPNDSVEYKSITYTNRFNKNVINKVIICGIQFGSKYINENIKKVEDIIKKEIVNLFDNI